MGKSPYVSISYTNGKASIIGENDVERNEQSGIVRFSNMRCSGDCGLIPNGSLAEFIFGVDTSSRERRDRPEEEPFPGAHIGD